jgi:hypothetical protein
MKQAIGRPLGVQQVNAAVDLKQGFVSIAAVENHDLIPKAFL